MSGIKPSWDCHARKRKKTPLGSYYNADFYFKVTQNGILGEHYSFRDLIFLIKNVHSYEWINSNYWMRQSYADRGGWYLRNPKAKYTAEPPDISIKLTIVSKYHHSGRSLSFSHQFHLQTVYCAFQVSDSLLLSHPVPKTNLTIAFAFLYYPSFLFLSFLLSIFCCSVNVRGVASP